jgi:translation initiation factor IF-2
MKYLLLFIPVMCYGMEQETRTPNLLKCNRLLEKMEWVINKMNREISQFESKEQYETRMLYLEGKLDNLQKKLHEQENGY